MALSDPARTFPAASPFLIASLLAVLVTASCSSSGTGSSGIVDCTKEINGCLCSAATAPADASASVACNPTVFAGTTCCADASWPSTGTCFCKTDQIYCGVVANAFSDGESGCVCTTYPSSATQVAGATCYAGGTTSGASLGICCMNTDGSCSCAAGLHTCGTGKQVSTCSAASFPVATGCGDGFTSVPRCS